jgi:hypothetical protein
MVLSLKFVLFHLYNSLSKAEALRVCHPRQGRKAEVGDPENLI